MGLLWLVEVLSAGFNRDMRLCIALQVVKEALYDAFYKLTDSKSQVGASIQNFIT